MQQIFFLGFLVVVSLFCVLVQGGGYGEPLSPEELPESTSPRTNATTPLILPPPKKCVATPNDPDADCIVGTGGIDYPIFKLPKHTNFNCSLQRFPGIYADPLFGCQVFYICQPDHRKDIFICPRGTILNQKHFVCDWFYNFNCTHATTYYLLNEFFYNKTTQNCTTHPIVTPTAPIGVLPTTVSPTTAKPSTAKPSPPTAKPSPPGPGNPGTIPAPWYPGQTVHPPVPEYPTHPIPPPYSQF